MTRFLCAGWMFAFVLSGAWAAVGQESGGNAPAGVKAVAGQPATPAVVSQVSSESLLPGATKAWFSIPDWSRMTEAFQATGPGQLAQNPDMKAFADSLRKQIDDYLDNRNFRLGITIDDIRDLRSGEICFAGVLPESSDGQGRVVAGSHGIVLLVNVAGREEQATRLLAKVDAELVSRGAVAEPIDPVLGVAVQRYRIQLKNPAQKRYTLHAISDGWLVASDNELIFRDILRRLRNPAEARSLGCLADEPSFQSVRQNVALEGVVPDLHWFIEPFGYIRLSQAVADEELPVVKRNNDYASKLQKQGFDVFRALGGAVAFNQLNHDLIHRTCVYAPSTPQQTPEQARCLRLFGLENRQQSDLLPEPFVPAGADSYMTLTWDLGATFDNLGPIVDEFSEGSYERLINGWKNDMGVDVEALIKGFRNRITLITATARPIDVGSERVAIAIPVSGDPVGILRAIEKMVGPDGTRLEKDGIAMVLVQKAEIDPNEEIDLDSFEMMDDEVDSAGDFDKNGVDGDGQEFSLFDKRYVAVARDHLFIANNEEFLLQLLTGENGGAIAEAADFSAVREALDRFSDPARVCAREFGRNDQMLEVNYEMLRQDRMVSSQTALAKILNYALAKSNPESTEPKAQRVDGKSLPSNYAEAVAPYLGPSGWVMERTEQGWLVSGCILKKKVAGELVRNPEDKDRGTRR